MQFLQKNRDRLSVFTLFMGTGFLKNWLQVYDVTSRISARFKRTFYWSLSRWHFYMPFCFRSRCKKKDLRFLCKEIKEPVHRRLSHWPSCSQTLSSRWDSGSWTSEKLEKALEIVVKIHMSVIWSSTSKISRAKEMPIRWSNTSYVCVIRSPLAMYICMQNIHFLSKNFKI